MKIKKNWIKGFKKSRKDLNIVEFWKSRYNKDMISLTIFHFKIRKEFLQKYPNKSKSNVCIWIWSHNVGFKFK